MSCRWVAAADTHYLSSLKLQREPRRRYAPSYLTAQFHQESAGGQDANRLVLAKRQQILVAGDDNTRFHCESSPDDVIVVGVAADRADTRKRTGEQPADLLHIRAPRKDRLFAMAIDVSEAGRQQSVSGFIQQQRREMPQSHLCGDERRAPEQSKY